MVVPWPLEGSFMAQSLQVLKNCTTKTRSCDKVTAVLLNLVITSVFEK
jgi:hypothetical protein